MQEKDVSLKNFLSALYRHQKDTFFPSEIMGKVRRELNLPQEKAISLLKECMQKDLLVHRSFKPSFYLVPGRVDMFPVVLKAAGLKWLEEAKTD